LFRAEVAGALTRREDRAASQARRHAYDEGLRRLVDDEPALSEASSAVCCCDDIALPN